MRTENQIPAPATTDAGPEGRGPKGEPVGETGAPRHGAARLSPLMSSRRDDYNTPAYVLDLVDRMGRIAVDPCSNEGSIVRAFHNWRLPDDGLALDWIAPARASGGLVYVNPPYGRQIGQWTERCRLTALSGVEVIALVPARVDAKWFVRDCAPPAADAVCFWTGRLRFLGCKYDAVFPSAIVYWGDNVQRFRRVFSTVGRIWREV